VIDQVALLKPTVKIQKNAKGQFNYEKKSDKKTRGAAGQSAEKDMKPGQVHSLKISEGEIIYQDATSPQDVRIKKLNAQLSDISWGSDTAQTLTQKELLRSAQFQGRIQAESIQVGSTLISNFETHTRGKGAVLQLDPTQFNVFGGSVRGNGNVDLRGPTPKIALVQNASALKLEQALKGQKNRISGTANVSVNLSATGKSARTINKTLDGVVSMRSENMTISGLDVDSLANKLKAAKGNVASLASSIFAGPIIDKDPQQAGEKAKEQTSIRKFVSDWNITNGIAQTKDVAFSTREHILAFQGKINLPTQTYQNFHIATVDPKGCVKEEIEIAGPLKKPRPVGGSTGKRVAESILDAAGSGVGSQVAGILGSQAESESAGCTVFYSGSALR
jgi:uncharacterized protein involved in outer membrane biogenesis